MNKYGRDNRMKKKNSKEIWSDSRYGTCRFCDGEIEIPGLDRYKCSSVSCGWRETEWGKVYYEALEKKEKEKKKRQREERLAQKEIIKKKEEKEWEEETGISQLSID